MTGWKARWLHEIGFVDPAIDNAPFGFLDPSRVIWGAHLIPSFTHGWTKELFPPSAFACLPKENDKDYQVYNIGIPQYVDALLGGHNSTHKATDIFRDNRHPSHSRNNDDRSSEEGNNSSQDNNHDNNPSQVDDPDDKDDNPSDHEQEDFEYRDPMQQDLDSDDNHQPEDLEDDALGPEDGKHGTQGIEDELGYAEL
ncbi:hypothetical protein C0991_004540 [Blastosporella zonata]|nr:hypothetical protein C0991_004540 [Blastosporella zonata]